MVVTPETHPGPQHYEVAGNDVWLRSGLGGLRALPVNLLILAPGLTKEQKATAKDRVHGPDGLILEL